MFVSYNSKGFSGFLKKVRLRAASVVKPAVKLDKVCLLFSSFLRFYHFVRFHKSIVTARRQVNFNNEKTFTKIPEGTSHVGEECDQS